MARGLRIKSLRALGGNEHENQAAYFDWVALHEKSDERFKNIWAAENGGLRDKVVAAKLKRAGIRPGVLDVVVDVPVTGPGGCWIPGLRLEHKVWPNKPTPEQWEFITRYIKAGFAVAVSYSWEASAAVTKCYFAGELDTGRLHIVGR